MNQKRRKNREFTIGNLWPQSTKNGKQNRSQSKKNRQKYINTSCNPFNQSLQNFSTILQPNSNTNFSTSYIKQQKLTPLKENNNNDQYFRSDKNQNKKYIKERVQEMVQNKLLPFFQNKLNSLQQNFKEQLFKFQIKIDNQNKQIKSLRQQNESLKNQIIIEKKRDIGTSPIRQFQTNDQVLNSLVPKLEIIDQLNKLLDVLQDNLQQQNIKKEERMRLMDKKIQNINLVNEQYVNKLTKITQIFNQNFVQLDQKLTNLDNEFKKINRSKMDKSVKYQKNC